MKYLFIPKLSNTNSSNKYNSNVVFRFFSLKLLLFLLLIGNTLNIKAQVYEHPPITICAGEEVVLSEFLTPPEPPYSSSCIHRLERTIQPQSSVVSDVGDSFTVAPLTTTTYFVESYFVSFSGPTWPQPFCPQSDNRTSTIIVINVEECTNTVCNITDPFAELPWLNGIITQEGESGFGYYDYVKLYKIEGETYLEVFSELPNGGSEIYYCDGLLYCERQDSTSCTQYNEETLYDTIYDTNCTVMGEIGNLGDNKIDLENSNNSNPIQLEREELKNFYFRFKNNGPCYLYETDFVFEVNGEIIGTEHWIGSIPPGSRFTVDTELKYQFKADTDYTVKIWSSNPNGNSDLNFTNDTLTRKYESFESDYNFQIQQFLPIHPTSNNTTLPVSIILDNFSNAKPSEIYIYWSVNGEEQEPLKKEDFAYNLEPASFWDKVSKNDTIEIGNYFFETGESYLIEAWVDLPPEIRDETQPQDLYIYFLTINSVNIDLAITGLNKPLYEKIDRSGEIHVEIINKSNVEIDEFTINWFINDVAQTPINIQNPDWETQTNNFLFDGKVSIPIGTLNIEGNLDYELRFEIETPIEYPDSNLANNSYTFSYKSDQKKYYDADLYVEVCKGDSVVLSVKEFSRSFPYTPGGAESCIYCDISFFNKRWTLDGALLDTTLAITVKPTADALYVFSSDTYGDCTNSNCSGASTQRDIKVGVVLIDCEETPNCINHFGRVSAFGDIISLGYPSSESNIKYTPFDTNGMPLNLPEGYLEFDYELFGPQITLPANIFQLSSSNTISQPITITCLKEKGFSINKKSFTYEVCEGDEIEEAFQIPSSLNSNLKEVICNSLSNSAGNNSSVESNTSDDCNFIFDVKEENIESNESITYVSNLQTNDYGTPVKLEWTFNFSYKNDCELICSNTPGIMQTSNTFVCAGESVFVREAFSTMDENSVKAYVLHEEKTFDGVNYIAIKKDGRFTTPGETYSNQRLYISAIFGSPGEDGMPILDNACTVWTPYGAKYTFFDPIEINVVDEKCENEAYYVDINITGGLGGLSPNRAYRSVSDGINTHTNVSVGEVVTFGPYQGESEYLITVKGAKGCEAEYAGNYDCGGMNRNASISWRGSDIFEIKYANHL